MISIHSILNKKWLYRTCNKIKLLKIPPPPHFLSKASKGLLGRVILPVQFLWGHSLPILEISWLLTESQEGSREEQIL